MTEQISILLKDVDVYQRELLVLSGVSLQISKGEIAYLIGKVGSGKSSLIKTLNAELPFYKGEAMVAGFDLAKIRSKEIPFLRRKLGVVFQDFQLLTDRSIYKNLEFVLKATGWKDEKAINERVMSMLEEVEMTGHIKKMPHQLSGGEQQRVVIARALLNDPELILADEPTGNLDPETSLQIMELFFKINREGKTVLVATHDKLAVEAYPARSLMCTNGKLIELASAGELIDFKAFVD
jgi:cell division transport system ATP-binding protein